MGTKLLPEGCKVDAESWARVLVGVRGARGIMHRMQCTWDILANVEGRRSGGAAEHSDLPVMAFSQPWGCCTLRKTDVASPVICLVAFNPVNALMSKQKMSRKFIANSKLF